MSEFVTVEVKDGIQLLTINRADKKNALTQDMYAVLSDSLNAAEDNPEIRVSVITGVADSFTAGNDLMDFLQNPQQDETTPVVRFLNSLPTIRKPLIAAVNGLAVGVGTTMLLHCDLVYASDNATFTLPFVNLALVPEAASSYLLPKMLGHQRAAELLLLGEAFDTQKALNYGVVNDVVPADQLLDTAMKAAAKLAAKPPEALRLAKGLMKGDTDIIAATMKTEGEIFQSRLVSGEAREAMTAFMEKRKPDFGKFS